MRTIKKYSNRRLYDTQDSRYLNLEDLARIVIGGDDVQVVDAATGADLTRTVLLQVLLEVQGGARLFPPGLLHRIIRFGGDSAWQRAAMQQLGAGLELLDAQLGHLERTFGYRAAPPPGPVPGSAARSPSVAPEPGESDPAPGAAAADPAAGGPTAAGSEGAGAPAGPGTGTPAGSPQGRSPAGRAPPGPPADEEDEELARLRERLAAIEARLERG